MALLTSAGFLGLHALATPGVPLDDMTAGFSLAARVGLLLAAGFAAISAVDPDVQVISCPGTASPVGPSGTRAGPGGVGGRVAGQGPAAGPVAPTR